MTGSGEIGTHALLDSQISETSHFQSHMHFDDSAESIADSDLQDGELQEMLTSPLYAQKASEIPDAMFSSEQGNLIRNSVFRDANRSNLRGSLLEGNKDHLLYLARSDLAKQELHVESLNESIGELQRQTEGLRLALQDVQYGVVEFIREQVRLQEELSMISKILKSGICTKCEELRDIKNNE